MQRVREPWKRVLACVAALACAASAASAPSTIGATASPAIPSSLAIATLPSAPDALDWLRGFITRVARGQAAIDVRSIGALGEAIADVRLMRRVEPEREREIASALLDLLGITLELYSPAAEERLTPPMRDAREALAQALEDGFDGDFGLFLTRDVLARAQSHPIERRRAAAWLYTRRKVPGSELALLTAARDHDRPLRAIALEALVGCPGEAVHRFFVDAYGSASDVSDPARMLAERHFGRVRFEAGSPASVALTALVRRDLVDASWRKASQAIAMSAAFDDSESVPWLIEALGTWKSRAERGLQGLRVAHEIELQLERRSGRRLGIHPENWLAWWDALRSGKIKKASTAAYYPEATRPSFFGLEIQSDRVLFVVDRSGSMSTMFDEERTRATRWQEATAQLCGFVEGLGAQAKFGVVVFHDYAEAWRSKLVPADAGHVSGARQWLTSQRPEGATRLRSGIEQALDCGQDGEPDLSKVEADTVVVLCDGATNEGAAWIEPFLERVNPRLRITFHSVLIGTAGDGALEALAKGSGGQFLRIDRRRDEPKK